MEHVVAEIVAEISVKAGAVIAKKGCSNQYGSGGEVADVTWMYKNPVSSSCTAGSVAYCSSDVSWGCAMTENCCMAGSLSSCEMMHSNMQN